MSLYLTIFADDETEIEGWVFGHYSDFGAFRDTVDTYLGASEYPTLLTHSDCDGEWSVKDIPALRRELSAIASVFRSLPPHEPQGAFEHTAEYRVGAKSLYECFHNVDGENIFEALGQLCDISLQTKRPILFQ